MSTCETVMVTPTYAKALRQTANFELQRPMSENNIRRLRLEMDADRFVAGTPIYFAVLPNGTMMALNGNHTLESISQGNGSIELTMIYQNVKSLAEAAAIYSRLDLHKMRSWRDSLRAFEAEDMLHNSTTWTAAFAAAMGVIMTKFSAAQRYLPGADSQNRDAILLLNNNRELRLRLMKAAYDAANLYVTAVGGMQTTFKRAGVFGVGIEIMRYQPSAGIEFFSGTAEDDGLRQGDPRKAILRWLRENPAPGTTNRVLQSRAVALAWNAFFKDRGLSLIRPNPSADVTILGTPWNGSFDPIIAYAPEIIESQVKSILKKKKTIKTGVDASGKPIAIHA